MKGDFSRNTFDPGNHYSAVLMQQGRVQVDADWNEQAAIGLHYLRRLAADLSQRGGRTIIRPRNGPIAEIEVSAESDATRVGIDAGASGVTGAAGAADPPGRRIGPGAGIAR